MDHQWIMPVAIAFIGGVMTPIAACKEPRPIPTPTNEVGHPVGLDPARDSTMPEGGKAVTAPPAPTGTETETMSSTGAIPPP
jgi:hypothetical protein